MIKETIISISKNFENLARDCPKDINLAAEIILHSLNNGGKVLFCGNGGSAADSQHLAAELIGRYRKNRNPIAALALTTDTSILTALSNDFSFDDIFERQLLGLGKKNDVLFAISTSGKSRNILKAIYTARKNDIKVIGFTGNSGGDMANNCDVLIKVPSNRVDRIQEMHIAVGHILCDIIESSL